MNNIQVDQFWDWFSANCRNLGVYFDNSELLQSLDRRIAELGNFSWEVGPGKIKDSALVISPNGDKKLLQDTKWIVNCAKACEGWEYYYAKPAKGNRWDMRFSIETSDEQIFDVDASQLEYILLKYEDGKFEIIIKAPDLEELDELDRQVVAEILLDGLLGEEIRIQSICGIDMVQDFDVQYRDKAGAIKDLSNHIKALIKE